MVTQSESDQNPVSTVALTAASDPGSSTRDRRPRRAIAVAGAAVAAALLATFVTHDGGSDKSVPSVSTGEASDSGLVSAPTAGGSVAAGTVDNSSTADPNVVSPGANGTISTEPGAVETVVAGSTSGTAQAPGTVAVVPASGGETTSASVPASDVGTTSAPASGGEAAAPEPAATTVAAPEPTASTDPAIEAEDILPPTTVPTGWAAWYVDHNDNITGYLTWYSAQMANIAGLAVASSERVRICTETVSALDEQNTLVGAAVGSMPGLEVREPFSALVSSFDQASRLCADGDPAAEALFDEARTRAATVGNGLDEIYRDLSGEV